MNRNKFAPGVALETPADLVGKSVQAYGLTGEIFAGVVVAAAYSDDKNDIYADVAVISYGQKEPSRLAVEARLVVQAGLALTTDQNPKPHTFSITR